MKKFYYIIIFFVVFGCANNKVVYWCGDHACINKKERDQLIHLRNTQSVRNCLFDIVTTMTNSLISW